MLSLDDPRWSALTHAYGAAADIPDVLARFRSELRAGTPSTDVTEQLFSSLIHQGDVYPATVPAVPHVIAAAAEVAPDHRRPALYFAAHAARGFADRDRSEYGDANAWSEFDAAMNEARALAIATARTAKGEDVLPDLLVVADVHGWHAIASAIEGVLDGGADLQCPACGADFEADFSDLDVDDDDPASPNLELLARLATEAGADDAAKTVLDLRGSIPCPECDEPMHPASL